MGPLGEAMNETQRQHLKLAFVLDYARRIVAADGIESYEEFRMLGNTFTRPMLRDAHFLDENDHLNQTFRNASDMAHQLLPTSCNDEERRDIFQFLFETCAVDALEEHELRILSEAGIALGFDAVTTSALIASYAA